MEFVRTRRGGNAFIENQAKEPGEALLTLVQFDTEYEFLHKGVPMVDVPKYELVPRGATALLDAVGRAINETGERLSKMNEADRPGLVVFVVMTDGLENSSQEFSKPRIKEMIQHQQETFGWQFTFLGADQDAFAEATPWVWTRLVPLIFRKIKLLLRIATQAQKWPGCEGNAVRVKLSLTSLRPKNARIWINSTV